MPRSLLDRTSFSQDAYALCDGSGRIAEADPQMCALLGMAREDLCRLRIEELAEETEVSAIRRALGTEDPDGLDTVLHRGDGSRLPVSLRPRPLRLEGRPCVLVQIAPRRRASESLPEEREFVRSLLGSESLLILAVDGVGRIVLFNRRCESLTGYRFEELRGRTLWDVLVSPSQRMGVRRAFEQTMLGSSPNRHEWEWIARDTRRLRIGWSGVRVGSGPSPGGVALFSGLDLTEDTRKDDELRRSRSLATIGENTAAIIHEIKNPLAAISAPLQVIQASLPAGHPQAEILDEVVQEVKRLDDTIRRLLLLAKPWTPKKETCDLRGIAQRVLDLSRSHTGFDRVTLRIHEGDSCSAEVDPSLVEQVLWNLVLNAAQAMPEGGTVRLSLESGPEADTVVVADDGPGMPEEVRAKVFQPFFTTKKGGSGLGLPTCRKIMEAHGGSLDLGSVPGAGTRITLRFPRPACVPGSPRVS